MKVLFLGEGKLAQICLKVLKSDDFRNDVPVASMVTSETFHNGFRAEHEEGRDAHFISNAGRNEDEILKVVNSLEIETLISVQHKWILSEEVISAVSGKAFNLHNAKLPDYKGHNTVSFAILNDEKEYTVTIHWIAPEVDSGDLVLESSVEVDPSDTARSLYQKTLPEAENLMKDFLRLLQKNEVPRIPLTGQGAYFPKNAWAANKVVALNDGPDLIDRKTRASFFPPYEPAHLDVAGKKIYCLPDAHGSKLWAKEKPLNKSAWDESHPATPSSK
jgi:methionyl-tRNA formyltransferase